MITRRDAALLLGAGLAGWSGPAFGQAPAALTQLRLTSAPDDDVTPVLYGIQAGLFRTVGLDVSIVAASSGAAVASAVVGGAVQLGKSSLLSIIAAHARGVPVTIVAPAAFFISPATSNAMIVPKDSPLRTARDLNGKVVSVPALNDLLWVSTKAWIDQNGGDSSTVHFIEAPVSMVSNALDSGRVVAGTLVDPTLTQDMSTGKYRLFGRPTDGISKRLLYSAWFASIDYVNQNHDVIEHFDDVLRRTAIYANGHHAQTVDLLAKFTGIEPSVIAGMNRTHYATDFDTRDMQPLIDAAARYKVIPSDFAAQDLISPYARKAYAAL
jgi:NitT/TauT family transport system substrate-binding protein